LAILSLHEGLALDGSEGHYGRLIGGAWTFADRVFGGYTAALAATAARSESPHSSLLAVHVVFLEAARPGPVDLAVTELRNGRTTWAGHTVAFQAGRPILSCDTWFGSRCAGGAPATRSPRETASPGPEAHPSIDWLRELYPFLGVLDETAVDYPDSATDSGGPRRIEVWARPSVPTGDDPFLAQIVELMLADAHLLDAAMRPRGLSANLAVSLDLTVSWEPPGPNSGWLNLVAEAGSTDGAFVACTGAIRAQDGTLRATAGQQGRVLPGWPRE
jgi:acyl-CoA thioesterase-2